MLGTLIFIFTHTTALRMALAVFRCRISAQMRIDLSLPLNFNEGLSHALKGNRKFPVIREMKIKAAGSKVGSVFGRENRDSIEEIATFYPSLRPIFVKNQHPRRVTIFLVLSIFCKSSERPSHFAKFCIHIQR